MKTKTQFHRYAAFLLAYTLIVILWGAWVRISHSGDGCGASWPLCNGQVIPAAVHKKTWVEFGHRLMSGLFGILIVVLYWRGRIIFPASHPVRRPLLASLIFMITEALLGAKLVLFGLVGQDDSVYRLVVMSLHHINSLLLTGSVALVVLQSGNAVELLKASLKAEADAMTAAPWYKDRTTVMLILFVAIAITGGFAALSSTLLPSSSLLSGLQQDLAPESHYLLRLRLSHPVIATLVGGAFALIFWMRSQSVPGSESRNVLKTSCLHVSMIFVVGVVFGYLTLFSLAPVWMKIVHLLFAHTMWIVLLRWWTFERTAKQSVRSTLPTGEGIQSLH